MQEPVVFRSKLMHPVLVMRNQKQDRDGNVIQEGSYIRFDNFTLVTSDTDIINFIRNLRSFSPVYNPNAEYYEVTQEDADKIRERLDGIKPNRPTVMKMPSDAQSEEEQETVASLSKKVNQLTGLLEKVLEKIDPTEAEADEELPEEQGVSHPLEGMEEDTPAPKAKNKNKNK